MPKTILLQRTTSTGTELAGRVTMLDSGEVQLTDMDDHIRRILTAGVIGVASRGRVYPKDGMEFMRALLIQFSGTYLRAVRELPNDAQT